MSILGYLSQIIHFCFSLYRYILLEHISMIFITMEDSACLIDDKSLLLKNILSHMNEFEQSRDVVSRFLDLAESAATTAEKIPNFSGDDLKRSNTKLEVSFTKIKLSITFNFASWNLSISKETLKIKKLKNTYTEK